MTHPGEGRLNDYVDGLLEPEAAAGVEDHLKACGACRERVEALRSLTKHLGDLPREIPPRRDLRPGTHGEVAEKAAAPAGPSSGWEIGTWLRVAAAAVALIGGGALIWFGVLPPDGSGGPDRPLAASIEGVVEAELGIQLRKYQSASRDLAELYRRHRGELADGVAQPVDASLARLEVAIRRVSEAVERHPDEPLVRRMLLSRYQQKVELLRRTLELWKEG